MKKINILSIDGGGSKGVIAIEQLVQFEKLFGNGKTLTTEFDMFSGTSTGGIIAVMLSVGYTATEIKELYVKHGEKIFNPTFLRFGIFRSKYNDKYFNEILSKYLKELTLSDCKSMCMIPAYNTSIMDTVIFKSMHADEFNYRLFDIVRATASAPTYFDSHKINSQTYIDGGLSINNPSMASFVEALKMGYDIINIMSIDTGRKEEPIDSKQLSKDIIGNVKDVLNISLNEQAQSVDYYMNAIYEFLPAYMKVDIGTYSRIESRIFNSSSKIDDFKKSNVDNMIKDGQQSFKLNKSKFLAFITNM